MKKRRKIPKFRKAQAKVHKRWWLKNRKGKRSEKAKIYDKQWHKENKKIIKIHKIVAKAIKEDYLKRPLICEKCKNKKRIYAHHEDYDKPFEIMWVCGSCHKKLPKGINANF